MKESNAVTSAKTKQITPEVLEEAIEWLETQSFICYALPAAMSGHPYTSRLCKQNDVEAAENFLLPLFKRDGIPTGGSWEVNYKSLSFTRSEWLRKIAQELREGKISA